MQGQPILYPDIFDYMVRENMVAYKVYALVNKRYWEMSIREKRLETNQFENFIMDLLNPNDPYQMHLAMGLFPEIFERRSETITNLSDN